MGRRRKPSSTYLPRPFGAASEASLPTYLPTATSCTAAAATADSAVSSSGDSGDVETAGEPKAAKEWEEVMGYV